MATFHELEPDVFKEAENVVPKIEAPQPTHVLAPPRLSRTALPTPRGSPFKLPEFSEVSWEYGTEDMIDRRDLIARIGIEHKIERGHTRDFVQEAIDTVVKVEVSNIWENVGTVLSSERVDREMQMSSTLAIIRALTEEHGQTIQRVKEVLTRCDSLETRVVKLEHDNAALKANALETENSLAQYKEQVAQLEANMNVLNKNNSIIYDNAKKTAGRIVLLEQGQAQVSATSSASTTTASHSSSKPKIADPPKYKGKKGSISLEDWTNKMGIWFRYHGVTDDEHKIITALSYLEEGASSYMDEYAQLASTTQSLGTWNNFVAKLTNAYRELTPELQAQQNLEKLCSKRHTLTYFSEQFQLYAHKSGYSDTDLIRRIDAQLSKEVAMVKMNMEVTMPMMIPTTWQNYLSWVLQIDANARRYSNTEQSASSTRPGKPVSTIEEKKDSDTRKPIPMAPEQIEWLNKRMCIRCGKHPQVNGVKCRSPKYQGYFEMPKTSASTNNTTKVRAIDENATQDEKMEYLRRQLESYDKGKAKDTSNVLVDVETTTRIEEVPEEDFLIKLL